MKNLAIAGALSFALITTGAFAQVKPADAPPAAAQLPTEAAKVDKCDAFKCELRLNNQELTDLFCGLVELDGRPDGKPVKDAQGGREAAAFCNPNAPRTPYSLGSLILTIGRDMAAIKEVAKGIADAQTKIEKRYEQFAIADDVKPDPNARILVTCGNKKLPKDKAEECGKEEADLFAAKNPVTLFPLSAKKLDLDKNSIPGSEISAIVPLLVDLP